MTRMIIFLAVVFTIWFGSHAFIAWSLARPLPRSEARWTVMAVVGLVSVAALGALIAGRGGVAPWQVLLRNIGYLYAGAFSILFVLTATKEIILGLIAGFGTTWRRLGSGEELISPERRAFIAGALNVAFVALTGGLVAAAYRGGTRIAPVRRVEVPIDGLHPDLDGYRIAQVCDVHVGAPLTGRDLAAIVERTNAVGADLIALVGDLVDGRVRVLADEVSSIGGLSARDGVFFVTGNHEYYSGADEWCAEIERRGLTVLTNEHRPIRVGDATLLVGGVTDYSAGDFDPENASDPESALAGAPDADLRVLLAHQPKSVHAAKRAGWDLQLSGHTHGGQFVPWSWIVGFFHPVSVGLHQLGKLWIYVSRGTGVWGPPMRLGAPNEITELVLRRAGAGDAESATG